MSTLWTRLDGVINSHGGLVEKHIGDAMMAVFGAKQSREDEPIQAVRAALAIQTAVNEPRQDSPSGALQLRVGIHTGLAVVGPNSAGEFLATGDTVNIAARLEQNAPAGAVLISHDTYRQVYGLFDVQQLPALQFKGTSAPVQAYVVLRAKPRGLAVQLRGVEGAKGEMVGRAKELDTLCSAFRDVLAKQEARLVTVVGEAGIGKSCLASQFQQWVELLPETVRLFSGRATAGTAGQPFALVRDAFLGRFEIQDSDDPALARDKLERGIGELLGSDPGAASEVNLQPAHAHFMGQLLGLDFSSSPWLRDILSERDQVRHRAFHAFARFFEFLGHPSANASQPAASASIFLAEDIHWADEGSLALLAHLVRQCRKTPLLVVCLGRPTLFERYPEWGKMAGSVQLDLRALSRQESAALVERILRKAPPCPEALRELIVNGADGIPFYIEEIVNMLIDQKVIVPGDDVWKIEPARLATARVPATLAGVLQARLDGLPPRERLILERAAVIGRIFWESALAKLCCKEVLPADVRVALHELQKKDLVFGRESSAFAGTAEWMFKHELMRNVAYETLLKKQRRVHHADCALWLIETSGHRSHEFAGIIAAHFEHSERHGEAAEWYSCAGGQAQAGYAPAAAIDYFKKALAIHSRDAIGSTAPARQDTRELEWLEGLSDALTAQARFGEALAANEKLRALAAQGQEPLAESRAWNALAFLQERLGQNRASIESAERAASLACGAGESGRREHLRALHLKGWAYYRLGDARAVLQLGKQTFDLCEEFGERRGLVMTFKLFGVAHLQLGHLREAGEFFEQGLALSQEFGDRRNAAAMHNNLGENARAQGDFLRAEDLYLKAISDAREIGSRESEAVYLTNLSAARIGLGKYGQVEADARAAIALTDAANSCALSATHSFLSEACLAQGKFAEARAAAQRALALARESENELDLGIAWRALGQVQADPSTSQFRPPGDEDAQDIGKDASACFAESLRLFQKIKAHGEEASTLQAWAAADEKAQRSSAARQKREKAAALIQQLKNIEHASV